MLSIQNSITIKCNWLVLKCSITIYNNIQYGNNLCQHLFMQQTIMSGDSFSNLSVPCSSVGEMFGDWEANTFFVGSGYNSGTILKNAGDHYPVKNEILSHHTLTRKNLLRCVTLLAVTWLKTVLDLSIALLV